MEKGKEKLDKNLMIGLAIGLIIGLIAGLVIGHGIWSKAPAAETVAETAIAEQVAEPDRETPAETVAEEPAAEPETETVAETMTEEPAAEPVVETPTETAAEVQTTEPEAEEQTEAMDMPDLLKGRIVVVTSLSEAYACTAENAKSIAMNVPEDTDWAKAFCAACNGGKATADGITFYYEGEKLDLSWGGVNILVLDDDGEMPLTWRAVKDLWNRSEEVSSGSCAFGDYRVYLPK